MDSMNNFIIDVLTKSLGSHSDDSSNLEEGSMNFKEIKQVFFMNGGSVNVRYRWLCREK